MLILLKLPSKLCVTYFMNGTLFKRKIDDDWKHFYPLLASKRASKDFQKSIVWQRISINLFVKKLKFFFELLHWNWIFFFLSTRRSNVLKVVRHFNESLAHRLISTLSTAYVYNSHFVTHFSWLLHLFSLSFARTEINAMRIFTSAAAFFCRKR